jgi:hypothetical protein
VTERWRGAFGPRHAGCVEDRCLSPNDRHTRLLHVADRDDVLGDLFNQCHVTIPAASYPRGCVAACPERFLRKKKATRSAKRKRQRRWPVGQAVSWMGRFGYAARGGIYFMVGLSAGLTMIDPSHKPGGFTESLKALQHGWVGGAVLTLLAAGMACFAGWLTAAAVYRRDHPGHAHIVLVAGMLGDAVVYVAFMASVLGMVFGAHAGGDSELQSWIAWTIAKPVGATLVGLTGMVVGACGLWLIGWGVVGDIEGPLELPPLEKQLMLPIGRYGTAGRGAAITLIGAYLLVSAIHGNPREAHELGGVLKETRALPFGAAIIGAFALAFIGSAVLDFVVAAFRHFNPRQP